MARAKKHRKLLVTGCGRSGTKYISILLRRNGMDVRHERTGRDGVASWYMAVDADRVPFGDAYGNFEFDHVFHQVRHPLAVIASVATFKEESWRFICSHTPICINEPLIPRCAKYWYYWNLEAEKRSEWCYRIEDFRHAFPIFCERLQLIADTSFLCRLSEEVNTRKRGRAFHLYEEVCMRLHLEISPKITRWLSIPVRPEAKETLTWEMLSDVDLDLSEKIKAKALDYGYTV